VNILINYRSLGAVLTTVCGKQSNYKHRIRVVGEVKSRAEPGTAVLGVQ